MSDHEVQAMCQQTEPSLPKEGGAKKTILFVDDEPPLRLLGQSILESNGFLVLVAEDGIEALNIYRRERTRISLVVLDLSMPRLSGSETFHAIHTLNDRVPVLFASGFAPELLTGKEYPQIAGFIAKPYRPSELVSIVRRTLEDNTTRSLPESG